MRGAYAALLPAIWPFSSGISVLVEEKYSWCISVRPQNRDRYSSSQDGLIELIIKVALGLGLKRHHVNCNDLYHPLGVRL